MNFRGAASGKMEMLEGQPRMSGRKSETAGGQSQIAENKMELALAQKWIVIASRILAICRPISLSIEIFGRAMATVHFSIVSSASRRMSKMLTDGSAIRRGNCLARPELHDRSTRFELERHAILGNRF